VSDNYHRFLSKKKEILPEESAKLSARDAFGIVMISHGEEFGEESGFGVLLRYLLSEVLVLVPKESNRVLGTSLVKFGQGMCRLATLQETQALTFKDTFSASLKMYHDEIKEYHVQRKKLESRRYEVKYRSTVPFRSPSSTEQTTMLQ
jgi:hypothetical protein